MSLTSLAPGQSKRKLRENMSATTTFSMGFESTLNNENNTNLLHRNSKHTNERLRTKIEPK